MIKTSKQGASDLEVLSFTPAVSRRDKSSSSSAVERFFQHPAAALLFGEVIEEAAASVIQKMFAAAENCSPRENCLVRRQGKQAVWVSRLSNLA